MAYVVGARRFSRCRVSSGLCTVALVVTISVFHVRKHMKKLTTQVIGLLLLLALLNVVFFVESPRSIVDALGVENSYLVVFIIATLGGLNWFSSPVLYAAIASFSAGGANPWLLGLAGGIGIAIGDTIIFLVLRHGYHSFRPSLQRTVMRFTDRVQRVPDRIQYTLFYLILGFTPTPNDLIMALLVVLQYRLRIVVPMLILSGVTVATLTAHAGGTIIEVIFN